MGTIQELVGRLAGFFGFLTFARFMKITKITAWQVDLPLHEGNYKWSGGKSVDVFDSTLVRLETDAGVTGYGEACPLGPVYLPSYAKGVRAGLSELAPALIGKTPPIGQAQPDHGQGDEGTSLRQGTRRRGLLGYSGQDGELARKRFIGRHLRGRFRTLPGDFQQSPEEMAQNVTGYREEGYRRFQLRSAAIRTSISSVSAK